MAEKETYGRRQAPLKVEVAEQEKKPDKPATLEKADKGDGEELTPRDVLYFHMKEAHENAKALKAYLLEKLRSNKFTPSEILRIVTKLGDEDARATEIAAKLAPYMHPKLEAIEVKSEVEHKFVIKAPERIKDVNEWAKLTGAEKLQLPENTVKIQQLTPNTPSIHDFADDEDATIEEERKTLDLKVN